MTKPNDKDPLNDSFRLLCTDDDEEEDAESMASASTGLDIGFPDSSSRSLDGVMEVKRMARKDTRTVRVWRIVVIVVLLCTGALVSAGAYILLRGKEEEDYQSRYSQFVKTIEDASQYHMNNLFMVFENFAETITGEALAAAAAAANTTTNANTSSFPFVTLPVFEVHGQHARDRTGAEVVFYSPLVELAQKNAWERYAWDHQGWLKLSKMVQKQQQQGQNSTKDYTSSPSFQDFITPYIMNIDSATELPSLAPADNETSFLPLWQMSPPPLSAMVINSNLYSRPGSRPLVEAVSVVREAVWTDVVDVRYLEDLAVNAAEHKTMHEQLKGGNLTITTEEAWNHPHSTFVQPVFDKLGGDEASQQQLVGILQAVVPWDFYLTNLLPAGIDAITCVLKNTCGSSFTYVLNGDAATFLGEGDRHDTSFSDMEAVVPLTGQYPPEEKALNVSGLCRYAFSVYPTKEFRRQSESDTPVLAAAAVAATLFFMAAAFCVYDAVVQRRNKKVVDAAARSNAIVSSMFPSTVRDRLLQSTTEEAKQQPQLEAGAPLGKNAPVNRLKKYLTTTEEDGKKGGFGDLDGGEEDPDSCLFQGKPIADLFPETTIIFADIAGFTAWSSVREPSQVFTLLETLYNGFDEIAKKRRVFKVETVGDCYVAVTGLPDPRKDHVVIMARFARDCMHRTDLLTKKLELTLGPDTADLAMRMGLHSGPVTAGVLRGERSRFQLFGDTMNTASRMESTGKRGKIQLSQDTADLLIAADKAHWLKPRKEKVVAKGKGEMQTYWLESSAVQSDARSRSMNCATEEMNASMASFDIPDLRLPELTDGKMARLIKWNADILKNLLLQIVAHREAAEAPLIEQPPNEGRWRTDLGEGQTVLDEVKEIITLPTFDAVAAQNQKGVDEIELDRMVVDQLHDYVQGIAAMYREHPFHGFEHASHVTMSVAKLMSRIVAPSHLGGLDGVKDKKGKESMASTLHDHTYGITSDPLTQFACVFSALIHDVDHPGVPNAQLIKENNCIALAYKKKSVAEQNSVDLAWNLLMDESYAGLRATIYQTDGEMMRFRQLVVNSVMATDIMDKDLKKLRNGRWDKAFSEKSTVEPASRDDINRKATIVIEHLIQASDIAHTMQHWHIYRKWNERFFVECYIAYKKGRADRDPAESWFQGELGFFDFYIIPLAKKLKDCGVFGVSSDEYLNYAAANREEWERTGREIVNAMVEDVNIKFDSGKAKVAAIDDPQLEGSYATEA